MCTDGRRRLLGERLMGGAILNSLTPGGHPSRTGGLGPNVPVDPVRTSTLPRSPSPPDLRRFTSSGYSVFEGCNNSNESLKDSEHAADHHRKRSVVRCL